MAIYGADNDRLILSGGNNDKLAKEAWAKDEPEVTRFIGIAKSYEELFQNFEAVVIGDLLIEAAKTVITYEYNLYTAYQQQQADKKIAMMIVELVVKQVGSMIERAANDIIKHIDDSIDQGRLRDTLSDLNGLRENIRFWLDAVAQSEFADMRPHLLADIIESGNNLFADLKGHLNESITAKDSCRAAIVYKNMVDCVQLSNHVLNVAAQDGPKSANAQARRNITSLLEYHSEVLLLARQTLNKQFYWGITTVGVGPHAPGEPPEETKDYYHIWFRGELIPTTVAESQDDEVLSKALAERQEHEFAVNTEYIRPLEDAHRKALVELENLA